MMRCCQNIQLNNVEAIRMFFFFKTLDPPKTNQTWRACMACAVRLGWILFTSEFIMTQPNQYRRSSWDVLKNSGFLRYLMSHIFGCVSKSKLRGSPKNLKKIQLSDSILKISSEDLLRPTWMRRKELQRGQLVGETVDPWRMHGWWRDGTGWDLLRISGNSWMKPATCTYSPSIFCC